MSKFTIRYLMGLGWKIFKNGEPWGEFYYQTEWEAIQELYDAGYDDEALRLQLIFERYHGT